MLEDILIVPIHEVPKMHVDHNNFITEIYCAKVLNVTMIHFIQHEGSVCVRVSGVGMGFCCAYRLITCLVPYLSMDVVHFLSINGVSMASSHLTLNSQCVTERNAELK